MVAILGSLAVTAFVFWLWVTFGGVVMQAIAVAYAPAPKPADASDGAYTVNVLPAPCPKDKPCPK
jgi:hypothetical protein